MVPRPAVFSPAGVRSGHRLSPSPASNLSGFGGLRRPGLSAVSRSVGHFGPTSVFVLRPRSLVRRPSPTALPRHGLSRPGDCANSGTRSLVILGQDGRMADTLDGHLTLAVPEMVGATYVVATSRPPAD